jgi:hypothetical protein
MWSASVLWQWCLDHGQIGSNYCKQAWVLKTTYSGAAVGEWESQRGIDTEARLGSSIGAGHRVGNFHQRLGPFFCFVLHAAHRAVPANVSPPSAPVRKSSLRGTHMGKGDCRSVAPGSEYLIWKTISTCAQDWEGLGKRTNGKSGLACCSGVCRESRH